jgi:hypothetical protein
MADYSATGLPPGYIPKHGLERNADDRGEEASAEEAVP